MDELSELLKDSCSWTLEFNPNKNYYEDLDEYITDRCRGDWVSNESLLKAIDTGTIYVLQVYPDTPVGFYMVYAATLKEIVDYLKNPTYKW